jgi:hypothetical protein
MKRYPFMNGAVGGLIPAVKAPLYFIGKNKLIR